MYIHIAFGTWPFGRMRFGISRPCVVLKPCLAQSAGLAASNAGSGTTPAGGPAGTTPAGATGASVEATSGAAPSGLTFSEKRQTPKIHTHTPFLDLSQMPTPLNFFTVDCKQANFVISSSLDNRFLSRPQLQDLRNLGQFSFTSYRCTWYWGGSGIWGWWWWWWSVASWRWKYVVGMGLRWPCWWWQNWR